MDPLKSKSFVCIKCDSLIDPPYNTENDFIYPDNFSMLVEDCFALTSQTDEEGRKLVSNPKSSGTFHTKWLNMMYPRLELANLTF